MSSITRRKIRSQLNLDMTDEVLEKKLEVLVKEIS